MSGKTGANDRLRELVKQLLGCGSDDSWEAAVELAKMGAVAVPALIDALKHRNSKVRYNAAFGLKEIGKEAAAAVPALIEALEDRKNNPEVRAKAAEALGCISEEAVPALVKALQDCGLRKSIRLSAAMALRTLGEKAGEAVPALESVFMEKENGEILRYAAMEALRSMREKAVSTVPSLIKTLDDEDALAQKNASRTLVAIGEKAVPALELALNECTQGCAAGSIIDTLVKIGKPAVPVFIRALKKERALLYWQARETLERLGERALPGLADALKNDGMHDTALELIRRIQIKMQNRGIDNGVRKLPEKVETQRALARRAA